MLKGAGAWDERVLYNIQKQSLDFLRYSRSRKVEYGSAFPYSAENPSPLTNLPYLSRLKFHTMGLLNQKGKGADKKKGSAPKAGGQGSKFIAGKATKSSGGQKKPMTGGSQRGS
jgi:hypothetical protein